MVGWTGFSPKDGAEKDAFRGKDGL